MKFKIEKYFNERSHIFALALHKLFGYVIEFFWDTAAYIHNQKRYGQSLIHAYVVTPNNHFLDVRGKVTKEEIAEEHNWNKPIYRRVTIEEVQEYMDSGFLARPYKGELEELKQHIQENEVLYQ